MMRIYLLTLFFSLAGSSFAQQCEIHPNNKSINDAEVGFNVLERLTATAALGRLGLLMPRLQVMA